MSETVIDNEFITMWFYPDKKMVHHKFKKYVKGEPFRNMLLTGTKLMQEKGATKWLSDDSDMPVLSPDDEEWGRVNWFPQTVKAGWKYWAIVLPKMMVGNVNMKRLASEYSQAGITAEVFDNVEAARKWLESR